MVNWAGARARPIEDELLIPAENFEDIL